MARTYSHTQPKIIISMSLWKSVRAEYQIKIICLYSMSDLAIKLSKFLPEAAAPIIARWIKDTGCQLRISKPRATKLGDYRAPFRGGPHKISINYDLNPYAFLMTTIHEFAHLKTWQQYKDRVKPHGEEWKNNFKDLVGPFLHLNIFPNDVLKAIARYMENPAASSCTDINLFHVLKSYDKPSTGRTIDSILEGDQFYIRGGRLFQKGKKLRKRFICIELSTNKEYLFSPIAEVYPLQLEDSQKNDLMKSI